MASCQDSATAVLFVVWLRIVEWWWWVDEVCLALVDCALTFTREECRE